MAIEIRPARADEMDAFGAVTEYAYAGAFGSGADNLVATSNRPEWTLCAFVDGRLATSYSVLPLTMRANGRAVALGGVSAVGTLPEFRRRGLLRRITAQSLADMRDRGQSVAALWASQAAIYQRYGYALASAQLAYRIDPLDVAFADGNGGAATVARVSGEAGFETIKRVYIEFVANRIGYLHRARPMWLNNALSAAQGPVHIAVASRDGHSVGYVTYHLRDGGSGHFTRNQEIVVRDLAWCDADAYRSLWSWLKRHDLVGRILWPGVPIDDPAGELFVEPRLLHAEMRDGIWLRVVDVAAALATRGYHGRGALTLEVAADDLAPWNTGRFVLDTDAGEAKVGTTTAAADVQLTVKALASLYSGHRSARQLKSWGLLDADDDAVARTDALFATRHAPHCPDNF